MQAHDVAPWWPALVETAVERDPRARTQLFLSQSAPTGLASGALTVACGSARAREWLEKNSPQLLIEAGADVGVELEQVTFVLADPVLTDPVLADSKNHASVASHSATSNAATRPHKTAVESVGIGRGSADRHSTGPSDTGGGAVDRGHRSSAEESLVNSSDGGRFNPKYDFDTFVVGPSNRFAHAAAQSVAEDPLSAYNPLLIYGSAGLGKTHLLHAIGTYITRHDPRRLVRYVTAEAFTTDFIDAVRRKEMGKFKDRYRKCDVLLLDDIHFLEGKDGTQEEFFHTFNTLHQGAGKIVITSDRHPHRFTTFEPRLKSRLEWGLQVDITPPNIETRIAILRLRTELDGLAVPDDVLELIAEHVTENIRQLEGALNRVVAYGSLQQATLSRELASAVLSDFIRTSSSRVTPERVIEVVANGCGISVEELLGRSRTRPLVIARHVAMYILRQQTDLSYPEIAKVFGGRDHTTVMHAVRKIAALMKERKAVYDQVDEFTQRIADGE